MKNHMKKHFTASVFSLNLLLKKVLYKICQLAANAKDQAKKEYYLDLAQRFRLWSFAPGSHETVIQKLDDELDLQIAVNICELVGMHFCAGLAFEPYEMAIMKNLIRPGETIFDVGANIGIHSLITSRLTGTGKVYAFEPASFAYKMLTENLRLNGVMNVMATKSIVSDQPGEVELYINSESALTSLGLTKRGSVISTEKVPCITLDEFASSHDIAKVDFLKIDVEGYEGHVLRGAQNLLKRSPELVILCELAEKNYKPLNLSTDEVIEWMRAHKYKVWAVDRTTGRLISLENASRDHQNQNYVFLNTGSKKESIICKMAE
jgi:FkbM family methyltransferase